MSVAPGSETASSRSYSVARQRRLRKLLVTYGVLTSDHLRELAHAECWHVPFELTLKRAVAAERIRRLGPDLYEAGPQR